MAIPTGTVAMNDFLQAGVPVGPMADGRTSFSQLVTLVDSTGTATPTGGAADPYFIANSPSANAGSAVTRVFTPTVQGSLIVKASAGNLYGYNIVSGASAGYLMIFDSATVPADGTVTPKLCVVLAANSSIQNDRDVPLRFTAGITMVFSTTGPFTKTISATAFLAGDAS